MKNLKFSIFYLIGIFITVLVNSCKKETEEMNTDTHTGNPYDTYPYTQLKVGNYWIYERFHYNPTLVSFNIFDSMFIEKDTMINNFLFYKKVSVNGFYLMQPRVQFLRDSSNFVVDENGRIIFTMMGKQGDRFDYWPETNASGDTIRQSFFEIESVTTFHHINTAGYYSDASMRQFYQHAFTTFPGAYDTSIYKITYYTKNVGITEMFYNNWVFGIGTSWGDSAFQENRLIRYHINH